MTKSTYIDLAFYFVIGYIAYGYGAVTYALGMIFTSQEQSEINKIVGWKPKDEKA